MARRGVSVGSGTPHNQERAEFLALLHDAIDDYDSAFASGDRKLKNILHGLVRTLEQDAAQSSVPGDSPNA